MESQRVWLAHDKAPANLPKALAGLRLRTGFGIRAHPSTCSHWYDIPAIAFWQQRLRHAHVHTCTCARAEAQPKPKPRPHFLAQVYSYYCFIAVAGGLWAGLAVGYVTEYYTSNAFRPVREVRCARLVPLPL